jgi:hypothetical protein
MFILEASGNILSRHSDDEDGSATMKVMMMKVILMMQPTKTLISAMRAVLVRQNHCRVK